MRPIALVAGAALTVAGAVLQVPTADAAPTCSLYVQSRVWVSKLHQTLPVRLGPNCKAAGVTFAWWNAVHPTQGGQFGVQLGAQYPSDVIDLWAGGYDLGRWEWQPGEADAPGGDVFQYTTYTDVREGSYGRVVPTRKGAKVQVKTQATRFYSGGNFYTGWSWARGQIQWRTPGTTTWHGLKDVYSSSAGAYSYTYTTSASRDYRVVLKATSTIWDSISPVVRR